MQSTERGFDSKAKERERNVFERVPCVLLGSVDCLLLGFGCWGFACGFLLVVRLATGRTTMSLLIHQYDM